MLARDPLYFSKVPRNCLVIFFPLKTILFWSWSEWEKWSHIVSTCCTLMHPKTCNIISLILWENIISKGISIRLRRGSHNKSQSGAEWRNSLQFCGWCGKAWGFTAIFHVILKDFSHTLERFSCKNYKQK